mmetsp:Transcript_69737/g.194942  ORF Transcript_69737/g.194942 Transcript_69737/m.194942 type:complete len:228 (-) Transcript_69737:753-1436(-)
MLVHIHITNRISASGIPSVCRDSSLVKSLGQETRHLRLSLQQDPEFVHVNPLVARFLSRFLVLHQLHAHLRCLWRRQLFERSHNIMRGLLLHFIWAQEVAVFDLGPHVQCFVVQLLHRVRQSTLVVGPLVVRLAIVWPVDHVVLDVLPHVYENRANLVGRRGGSDRTIRRQRTPDDRLPELRELHLPHAGSLLSSDASEVDIPNLDLREEHRRAQTEIGAELHPMDI